ncbi:MAG: PaaI family thioesterase [Bacillota bacterium]
MMKKSEVINKGLDEAVSQIMCSRFSQIPTLQTLGVSLVYLGPGECSMKLKVVHDYTTVKNRLHGGIIATLADSTMGWSVASLGRVRSVTVDMNINYFAPIYEGSELISEAYVIHAGRTTVVAEANVYNQDRKLLAKARGTFYVTGNTAITGAH